MSAQGNAPSGSGSGSTGPSSSQTTTPSYKFVPAYSSSSSAIPLKTAANTSTKAKVIPPYKGPLALHYKVQATTKVPSTVGSFVYCWERVNNGSWKNNGILFVDKECKLRNAEKFIYNQSCESL